MNLTLVLEKNTTPQNWNARREALLALFRSQEYGIRPEVPYEQTERLRSEDIRSMHMTSIFICI